MWSIFKKIKIFKTLFPTIHFMFETDEIEKCFNSFPYYPLECVPKYMRWENDIDHLILISSTELQIMALCSNKLIRFVKLVYHNRH